MDGNAERAFGDGDASLQAMGGEAGVGRLVDTFFDNMERLPEARTIRDMHPDLELARECFPRLVGLRDGRVVFDGAPRDLSSEHFESLYRLEGSGPGTSA